MSEIDFVMKFKRCCFSKGTNMSLQTAIKCLQEKLPNASNRIQTNNFFQANQILEITSYSSGIFLVYCTYDTQDGPLTITPDEDGNVKVGAHNLDGIQKFPHKYGAIYVRDNNIITIGRDFPVIKDLLKYFFSKEDILGRDNCSFVIMNAEKHDVLQKIEEYGVREIKLNIAKMLSSSLKKNFLHSICNTILGNNNNHTNIDDLNAMGNIQIKTKILKDKSFVMTEMAQKILGDDDAESYTIIIDDVDKTEIKNGELIEAKKIKLRKLSSQGFDPNDAMIKMAAYCYQLTRENYENEC